MRVAIVGPAYPYKGGGAQHTTELAHRLRARGHDVVIESWSAQYPARLYPGRQTIDTPEGAPFPHVRRALSWRRPDGWWRTGRRVARTADVLILAVLSPVQVPSYLTILAGARSARPRPAGARRSRTGPADADDAAPGAGGGNPGLRVVALCHNVLPHERRAVDVTLMRTLLRRVDAVLTHSEAQSRLARGLTGPATPVHTAALPPHLPAATPPSGTPPSGTPPSAAASGPADAGRCAGKVTRRLLFFGIVRPYKGLDVLLRALALGPADVRLTVAGEFWGGTEATERLVGELGLGGRVELRPGYVPAADVPGLFAGADALVLPYRSATASQNAWLGFEHGVPVIATRVGALADHIRDGVDGLLCAPGDVADLAKTLDRFYTAGEPERLRAAVHPIDPDPHWNAYLDALTTLIP